MSASTTTPTVDPCAWHVGEAERLPYIAWHERAEGALERDQAPRFCSGCSRFIPPWERRS